MLSNNDSLIAKTSVLIVGMENSHSEVNEKLDELSRDTQRGQILEGQPLSTPSRALFIKLSRICLKHPYHETKMSSVGELRETSSEPRTDPAEKCHVKAWNSTGDNWRPSKSPMLR